jgi:hypothetical protein
MINPLTSLKKLLQTYGMEQLPVRADNAQVYNAEYQTLCLSWEIWYAVITH